jgi:hypothetical protein
LDEVRPGSLPDLVNPLFDIRIGRRTAVKAPQEGLVRPGLSCARGQAYSRAFLDLENNAENRPFKISGMI